MFISHHHAKDQAYKESLVRFGEEREIFLDESVDTGDISDDLSDERIREKIRVIDAAFEAWRRCEYDLSATMRRKNT